MSREDREVGEGIPDNFPTTYISQHLALLRLRELNPTFVAASLSSSAGKSKWQELNRSAIKSGLNFDDIRSFQIPVPPLPLQKEFAQRVKEIRALEAAQAASRRRAARSSASGQRSGCGNTS